MNILIAEDEKILARVLKEEFEAEGYNAILVTNGSDALKALGSKNNKPSIMLLDILMPVMDGFQVLEEMRKDQVLSSIPVIVLSNLGQDEEIKKALKLGAVDYFVKSQHPILEVVEKVRKFLDNPRKKNKK